MVRYEVRGTTDEGQGQDKGLNRPGFVREQLV